MVVVREWADYSLIKRGRGAYTLVSRRRNTEHQFTAENDQAAINLTIQEVRNVDFHERRVLQRRQG